MNKRRNYFIDKGFQSDFIIKFCALVASAGLLIMAIVYLLARNATTVSFVNSRVVVQSTADFLLPVLVQTLIVSVIVVSVATIIFTLFVSHRIAGPAFRFKKVLKDLAKGDFCGECRIRKKDSLHDVAGSVNELMAATRAKLKETDAQLSALKEAVKEMPDQAGTGNVKKTISDLEKLFHHFKF
jgi:HAMP domain-containing protein